MESNRQIDGGSAGWIRTGFPDCIASRKGKRIRIEFEYESRNFRAHGHSTWGCDWIVCWIHNWLKVPQSIRVIELRKEFGLGFNVWSQAIKGNYFQEKLAGVTRDSDWTLPARAKEGDLVLFYLTRPHSEVRYLYRVTGTVGWKQAGW